MATLSEVGDILTESKRCTSVKKQKTMININLTTKL
jgi:hypothetical protein